MKLISLIYIAFRTAAPQPANKGKMLMVPLDLHCKNKKIVLADLLRGKLCFL